MARQKNTVEYFPFYVKDGKTLFALQEEYGIAGIGYFTQLFRYLSQVPEHWISFQDEYDRRRFIKYMGGDETICIHIVNIMCTTGKLDKTLWETKGVIVSEDFLDSLEKVYSRRANALNIEIVREKVSKLPDFDVNILYTSCKHIVKKSCIKERKGKERKVNSKYHCDSKESPPDDAPLELFPEKKIKVKPVLKDENWKYIESLFREKKNYDNWGKQRRHVKELDKRIQKIYKNKAPPMSLKEFTKKCFDFFMYLIVHGKQIWRDQENCIYPSTWNSERIWTMYLAEIEQRRQPSEKELMKGLEDL